MVKIRNVDIPPRFLGWFFSFYLIFLFISLFFWRTNTADLVFWFWMIHPSIWIFFYITLSYKYNIFKRCSFILGIPSLISIFIIDSILYGLNEIGNIFFEETIFIFIFISGFVFLAFSLFGSVIGWLVSLIIADETKLTDEDIINNSVSFKLEGNEGYKKAIISSIVNIIKYQYGYPQYVFGSKNSMVYTKLFPFSGRHVFITHDMNRLTIFPFIKDGFYFEPNHTLLPHLTVIGERILKLKRIKQYTIEYAENIIHNFTSFSKPNKILLFVRSVKGINYRDVGVLLLGVFIVVMFILLIFHPEVIIPNIVSGLGSLVTWLGVAIIGVIFEEFIRNKLRKKNE